MPNVGGAAMTSSSTGDLDSAAAPIADEHRREIVRFYLALRVLFLIVSLAILTLFPEQLTGNQPDEFTKRLWWAWLLFFGWTIPLVGVTRNSQRRRLILADRLISVSIVPDTIALYFAASVTGGAAGLVYRSIYFLIAIHSYHFSPNTRSTHQHEGRARVLPLVLGALLTVVSGMTVFCSLVDRGTPVAHYVVEGGLQAITAAAFLLVRWSDLTRAEKLDASQQDLRGAEQALERQRKIETRLLEAMQDVSTMGRISDQRQLDEKLRDVVRVIGQNLGSEYCVLGLVRDERLVVAARYASFRLTEEAKHVLEATTSRPLGDGLVGSVLERRRKPFRWNSTDARDLVDLSDDELKMFEIALDRTGTRRLRDEVLPSHSIRHLIVVPLYTPDERQEPLGYLELINDMSSGALSASGFSLRDEERLETIASQIAVAISNFERHRGDLARADHEAFFSSLILTLDLDDLFDKVLNHLNIEYASRVASLWLATEDGFGSKEERLRVVLRSVVAADLPGAQMSKIDLENTLRTANIFHPTQCYIGRFFGKGRQLSVTYVDDMRTVTDSWADNVEQIGTSHLIAIPICRAHERSVPKAEGLEERSAEPPLAGVVCLRPLRPFELTVERREALERFADYLAVVIDQVRFRARYRQIEILRDQLPVLQSANITDFYQGVVGLVRTALSAEACSLFTIDPDGALILKATTAAKAIRLERDGRQHEIVVGDWVGKVVFPADESSITAQIAETGHTTLISDVHRNPARSKLFMEVTPTVQHESMIVAPILHTDKTLFGVIRCINREKAGALLPVFVTGDQEFLDLIMGIMMRFIENAEASEAKADFLRRLAHELSTPLAALKNQIDFLEDIAVRGRPVGNYEEQFGYLGEQADFIQYLVSDIQYQFGKGAALRTRFEFRAADLRPTIERIKKLLLYTARMDKQTDIVTGTARMPMLYVDARRMEQVIFNMIQNAVKYSRTGSGKIFVAYDFVKEMDPVVGVVSWHRLAFQDWGVGVRQKDLPFIFEEYRRGSNTEGASGTGLGLAVAKRIVEAHGGRISVTSLKAPTIFAVDLPEYLSRRPPTHATSAD